MQKMVLATHNAGKLREIQSLLAPIQCIAASAYNTVPPEETGLSFIENAILKARHVSRIAHLPALADDSGLVIPALLGKPGIYSARFAGAHASDVDNYTALLQTLSAAKIQAAPAYFYCAMALVRHPEDPTPLCAFGRLDGVISDTPQGANGFGYDPVFYIPHLKKTLAECTPEEKNAISHRAQALGMLKEAICAGAYQHDT